MDTGNQETRNDKRQHAYHQSSRIDSQYIPEIEQDRYRIHIVYRRIQTEYSCIMLKNHYAYSYYISPKLSFPHDEHGKIQENMTDTTVSRS